MWVGRDTGGQPDPAAVLLRRAGALLLGRPEAELVLTHDREGRPLVRAGGGRVGRGCRSASAAPPGWWWSPPVGPAPVGVDVERVRPLPALALARRSVPAGRAGLVGADRPEAGRTVDFLRLWTAKEAVGKALGQGLRGGGLRRAMAAAGAAVCGRCPAPRLLRVGHAASRAVGLVLAVAVRASSAEPVDVEVVQRPGHGVTAVRSASVERTSLPVVVRGNWSSRCSARGRL